MEGDQVSVRCLSSTLEKVLCCVILIVWTVATSESQSQPPNLNPADIRALQDVAAKGFAMNGSATVKDNVSVEAVLLPASVAKRVFGAEIANQYACIQLTISNRSQDAALIVHSVYIDYSEWALGGGFQSATQTLRPSSSFSHPWQASTIPSQIASAEYRIVRGELLDAQQWTKRNVAIRILNALGAIASGYAFALKEKGIIRGIAAYSGQVVPAAEMVWPDGTTAQMNRISDVGFQVNKAVGKDNSEIVVAFFPIDRFLIPSLKRLFLKSPALFFTPYALLLDKSAQADMMPLVQELTGKSAAEVKSTLKELSMRRSRVPAAESADATPQVLDHKARDLEDFVNRLSLNSVRVVVGGTMAVDADLVAPTIESVEFDGGNSSPAVWASTGEKKGAIVGRFLAGAEPAVTNGAALGISDVKASGGASERRLEFSLILSKPIDLGQTLTFQATKKDKQQKVLRSNTYDLVVNYLLNSPAVTSVAVSGEKLEVFGKGFFTNSKNQVSLKLVPSRTGLSAVDVTPSTVTSEKLEANVKDLGLAPACWSVNVVIGNLQSASRPSFAVEPQPQLKEAIRNNNQVDLSGSDLISLPDCGVPLEAFYTTTDPNAQLRRVEGLTIKSDTELSFTSPSSEVFIAVLRIKGKEVARIEVPKQ